MEPQELFRAQRQQTARVRVVVRRALSEGIPVTEADRERVAKRMHRQIVRERERAHQLGAKVLAPQIERFGLDVEVADVAEYKPRAIVKVLERATNVATTDQARPSRSRVKVSSSLLDSTSRQNARHRVTVTDENRSDPVIVKKVTDRTVAAVDRHVRNAAREVVEDTAESAGEEIGWARVLSGAESCPWCAMLASRGPVYKSQESAGAITTRSGRYDSREQKAFHDNCDCIVVLVREGEDWYGREHYELLEDLWIESTAGLTAPDSAKAFARAVRSTHLTKLPATDESAFDEDEDLSIAIEVDSEADPITPAAPKPKPIVAQSTRDLVNSTRESLPKDRAGWLDTTIKYPRDKNGAKLVPEKLQRHLDSTLAVGKAVRGDAMARIAQDTTLDKLTAEERQLVSNAQWLSPRRNEIRREVARREQAILLEALSEIRSIGGVEQATEISTLDIGDAQPGTAAGIAAVRRAEAIFPDDWLQAASDRGPLRVGAVDRAFYNGDFDFIAAPNKDYVPDYRGAFDSYPDEVMAHELGHRMERVIPGLTHLEFALVRSRSTKNGELEPVTQVYPNKPELADEVGYEDDWHHRYAGKTYANDSMADPATRAAEAFQVGLQDTFGRSDPSGEFDKSTQLQEFVIGVMALL